MVNRLLTISIKVNVLCICRITSDDRGLVMKKVKTTRGFWNWLKGHGWDTAGSNGYPPLRSAFSDRKFNELGKRLSLTGAFTLRAGSGRLAPLVVAHGVR